MQIEFIGKFYDNQSLSIVNRKVALQLKELCDLSVIALDSPDSSFKVKHDEIDQIRTLEKQVNSPDVQIRHSYPTLWIWPEQEKTKVVYIQPWEYSSIPSEWQYKFDTFADAIISPSVWNSQVYKQAGINPNKIFVVPNGYDELIFKPTRQKSDTIKFIYVGCNQFRKGIDILLNSWARVTKSSDNVELIIKDTPQVYGKSNLLQDITQLQYNTKCAKITYRDESMSEDEIAAMYSDCSFVIHPYRGEGFGMHIQEAMACGCYPIVTAGGPTDEFATGYKIDSTRRVVNPYEIFALKQGDSMSNMGQHRWVLEPNASSLDQHIKAAIKNKQMQADTSKLNTWKQVAEKYAQVLTTISARKAERVR
jgi:glycosyltransferase involved in cell wall biosynthesis